jgi:hypothetical protein
MTDKELQDLISLKKYEQPEEGYFDDFLQEFQQRQRSEMLNTSARGLLLERVKTWFSELGALRWVAGAGVAYAAVALVMNVMPNQTSGGSTMASGASEIQDSAPTVIESSAVSEIISAVHSAEGDASEVVPVSMVFANPVDFSSPAPVFSAEERIF